MNESVKNTVSQGMLAKLLATENIQIHVGNYRTAFFDVKNRILGLPSWNVDSKHVSDLLIGHEVGHALYTPVDSIEKFKAAWPHIPFSILNVVEDIRIERLIQSRYPGLVNNFNRGYEEFLQRDFFKIAGKNINKLGFADRLNIKGKLRHLVKVRFTAEENVIFDRCRAAETFDEVVGIVLDIYEMVKNEKKPVQTEPEPEPQIAEASKDTGDAVIDPQQPDPPSPSDEAGDSDDDEDDDDKSDDSNDLGNEDDDEDEDDESDSKDSSKSEDSEKDDDGDDDTDDEDEAKGSSDDSDDGDSEEDDDSDDESDDSTKGDDSDDDDSAEDEDDESDSDKGGDSDEDDDDSAEDEDEDEDEDDDHSTGRASGGQGAGDTADELEPHTPYKSVEEELESESLDSLNDSLGNMQVEFGKVSPVLMPSKEHIDAAVIPWKSIIAGRKANENYMVSYLNNAGVLTDWKQYKKNTRKNIQNLITDFERKKAAWQYSRSESSPTGDIDVGRLYSYRYEDNIFNSITKLADAKSHGMMFFIDYSGSMNDDIHSVLDHTLSLAMFCKAVSIPFSVYTFTNGQNGKISRSDIPTNQISLANARICELLSSEMPAAEYELACRHLRGLIYLSADVSFMGSQWEMMSATPISETLIIAHELIARFRKKHHVQKMNVIFLSDGEGQPMTFGYDSTCKDYIKTDVGAWKSMYSANLQGREIVFTNDANHTYATLVSSLRHTMGCTVIGFYITRRGGSKKAAITSLRYAENHGATNTKMVEWRTSLALAEKELRFMRKNKCMFIAGGFNFNSYFIIDARAAEIEKDAPFEPKSLDPDTIGRGLSPSEQNKLAREFTKYNLDKKSNRIILAKFAELVA